MSCSFCPNCALDPVWSISCPLEQVCNTPCCMDPLTTNLPVFGVEHTTFEEFVVNILLYGSIDNKFAGSWSWTYNIWGMCSHPMFSSFYLFSTVLLLKWKVQFFRCKLLRVIIMFAYLMHFFFKLEFIAVDYFYYHSWCTGAKTHQTAGIQTLKC